MASYFVSRHQGAKDWARAKGIEAVFLDHIDPHILKPGDIVMGILPVSIAADVCAVGARYFHLSMDLPEGARQQDLSMSEMAQYGARLEEYLVRTP